MFYRISILFFCFFLLYSCKKYTSPVNKNIIVSDSLLINKYITGKKPDSAALQADQQLSYIIKNNSPDIYIKYNQWLTAKMGSAGASWKVLNKYYSNIYSQDKKPILDSSSFKLIIQAYYKWAEISYRHEDRTDDSVIICLEKTIGLNTKTKALPLEDEAYAYKMLGILYTQLGDTKKALTYYGLESQFVSEKYVNGLAGNVINRSIALEETGHPDSAISLVIQTLQFPGIATVKIADMLTILSKAQFQKGMMDQARVSVMNALHILDTISGITNDVKEKTAMALKQRGLLERINKNFTGSVRTQLNALKYYKETGNSGGRDIAKIYIELGKSYAGADMYDSALTYYQIALHKTVAVDSINIFSVPVNSQLYAENTIMESLDAKADALQEKFKQTKQVKYLEIAARCYGLSFDVERKLMQNFSYDESRLIMLKESRRRSETAIGLCYQLLQLTRDNNWTEKAFLFAEKSKAFVLLESIKRNIAANTVLQNDTLYQQIQSMQLRLTHIDREIAEVRGDKKDSLINIFTNQKTDLTNQLLLANNEFKRTNASYKPTNEEDNVSIALTCNKLLDNHSTLIEFFTGDSSTYIFSFSKNTPPVFLKSANGLTQTLNNFLLFFTDKNKINNNPAAYQAAGYTLYQQAGFSAIDTKATTKLLIIPDGRFNFVPFEALITGIQNVQSPKLFSYLILQQQINYGYSAATLLQQSAARASSSSGNIICFAPVFENNERGETPLTHTIDELAAIKKETTNGNYYLKEAATLGQFKKDMTTAGIIHIASHAHADTSRGMQPLIEFYDSTLYLNEIYAMPVNPDLVVLSACETGIGVLDKSEGAMSLARGFYYAGAKNIITSLWSVDDRSTAGIFGNFYSHIPGSNYGLALHKAKLQYLENTTASTASPYYWAGFVHIGYEKQKEKSNRPFYIISILLIAILSVFILRRRR